MNCVLSSFKGKGHLFWLLPFSQLQYQAGPLDREAADFSTLSAHVPSSSKIPKTFPLKAGPYWISSFSSFLSSFPESSHFFFILKKFYDLSNLNQTKFLLSSFTHYPNSVHRPRNDLANATWQKGTGESEEMHRSIVLSIIVILFFHL